MSDPDKIVDKLLGEEDEKSYEEKFEEFIRWALDDEGAFNDFEYAIRGTYLVVSGDETKFSDVTDAVDSAISFGREYAQHTVYYHEDHDAVYYFPGTAEELYKIAQRIVKDLASKRLGDDEAEDKG